MTPFRRLAVATLVALLVAGLWLGWQAHDEAGSRDFLVGLTGYSGGTVAPAPSSGREFPLQPPSAPGSRLAAAPWAANAQRWIRRDIPALLRDARASPQTGSYYFGHRAARYCVNALAEGDLSELVRHITTESAADPALLKQRIAAARALLAPCKGMTFQEAMDLGDALVRDGDRVGDARLALDRKLTAVFHLWNSTATSDERQRLLEEVLFLDDPDLIYSSIGLFGQAGSVVAGHTVIGEHGDQIVYDAMLLVLCGTYGECSGYGSADEACALKGACSTNQFEYVRRSLPADDWEPTYALYLGIQGALGAKDPSAFRVKWPDRSKR